jgi:hypothetical protein
MKSIVTRPELGSDTREPIEWRDHVRVRRSGGPGWCGSSFDGQSGGKEQYETEHARLLSRPNCARLPAWQKMTELKGWRRPGARTGPVMCRRPGRGSGITLTVKLPD